MDACDASRERSTDEEDLADESDTSDEKSSRLTSHSGRDVAWGRVSDPSGRARASVSSAGRVREE